MMVGSGFSRVCALERDAPVPPLWGDFAHVMEVALDYASGRAPGALRLAQEYQALHGRDGLDRLIRQLVTDDQWEPSRLHRKLIELPWCDILTTNWDTLLERTSPKTPDRIYSCVRTIHDIARQRSPRIIKLHGSLPSHTPLIFTEDDFRTYPTQFAPFVNLTQQIMLENELCLLGFSGVDPNFLAWSGWVRDTLSISARRIRLVGVLNLNPAARTLLEQRNVTPIDLGLLVKDLHPSHQHEQALELLFDALVEAKPRSPFDWKVGADRFNASPNGSEFEKLGRNDVATAWAKERAAYPGWIVAPHAATWGLLSSSPRMQTTDEKPEEHLRFASERLWRHRIAGAWMYPADLEESDKHFDEVAGVLSPQQRTDLCVSAASHWRIFRRWDHWSRWMERLAAVEGDEPRLSYAYETGLKAILDWNDAGVQQAADALTLEVPIWAMRRAGLLSTLFQYRASAELYQSALMDVRRKLKAAPKSAWLISLEGWGALFHKVTRQTLTNDSTYRPEDESDETRMRYVAAKADPWDEISRRDRLAFERTERNRKDTEEWELSFRPGRFRSGGVRRLGGDDECPFYGLIALMETTGAPERSTYSNLFSDRLVAAYRALKEPDEDDLMAFLARYRGSDYKILDQILPRRRVARMSAEAVEQIRDGTMRRIDRMLANREGRAHDDHIQFLLALLARVIIRSDSVNALKVIQWSLAVLYSPSLWWNCYKACGEVLQSAIEVLSDDNIQAAITVSLELKLPSEAGASGIERDWPELIDEFLLAEISAFKVDAAASRRIDQLIEVFRNGDILTRTRALTRLHRLFRAQKLSEAQISSLEQVIWTRCEDDGWPADTDLLSWVYLDLPGRAHAEPLFLSSIVKAVAESNFSHSLAVNLRAGIGRISEILDRGMLVACVEACLSWRPKPIDEDDVHSLFSGDAQLEKATSKEIGYALAHALLPCLSPSDLNDDLSRALERIPNLDHIPTISATAFQIGRLCPDMKDAGIAMIRAAIASRDPERVYPTFVAVAHYVDDINKGVLFPRELSELLLHIVEQRLQPGLGSAMKFIGDLILADTMSPDYIGRLAKALPEIIEEYRYDQDRLSVPSLAELPAVRREAHRLIELIVKTVPALAELRATLASDPLPEVRRARAS